MTTSVVVTGAASGIGRATALLFGRTGHRVVCVDRDEAGVRSVAQAVGGYAVPGDVADDDTARRAVQVAREAGALVAVCNIAGVYPHDAGVLAVTDRVWDEVMAVNVRAVVHFARHAVPVMRTGGVIVNMASVHAYAAVPDSAPYAALKGAVVALTRQMALDLARYGVRVVAVAPGAVDTPMSSAASEADGRSLAEQGFGRVAQAAEVAEVIRWLAGDAASFVNGTTVVADGGLLARLPAG